MACLNCQTVHLLFGINMNRIQKLLALGCIACALALGAIFWAEHVIEKGSADAVKGNLESLPQRQVALVLGCSPTLGPKQVNQFFVNRMQAAADVYHAHKANYLLVSGDNRTKDYDEPTAMKNALVRLGVPEDHIVLDYAGFSTLDSVVRAKEVFGLSQFCIISQRDHAMRAVFIAHRYNLDVVGYAATDVWTIRGLRTHLRESLARVRTVLDVTVLGRKPHFLGPKIQIGDQPSHSLQPGV